MDARSPSSSVAFNDNICYKKTTRKAYVKYWAVLLRRSVSSPNCIELYEKTGDVMTDDQQHVYEFEHPQLVIKLDNVLCVRPMQMKGKTKLKKYEFQIVATNTKHQFATNEAEECRTWVKKLNRLLFGPPESGVMYEFRVEVIQTSHSEKLGLYSYGYYVMRVSDTTLILYSASGKSPTQFQCSLDGIIQVHHSKAKMGSDKENILSINTTRNSEVGEGGFAFHTDRATEIASIIKHRSRSQQAGRQKYDSITRIHSLEDETFYMEPTTTFMHQRSLNNNTLTSHMHATDEVAPLHSCLLDCKQRVDPELSLPDMSPTPHCVRTTQNRVELNVPGTRQRRSSSPAIVGRLERPPIPPPRSTLSLGLESSLTPSSPLSSVEQEGSGSSSHLHSLLLSGTETDEERTDREVHSANCATVTKFKYPLSPSTCSLAGSECFSVIITDGSDYASIQLTADSSESVMEEVSEDEETGYASVDASVSIYQSIDDLSASDDESESTKDRDHLKRDQETVDAGYLKVLSVPEDSTDSKVKESSLADTLTEPKPPAQSIYWQVKSDITYQQSLASSLPRGVNPTTFATASNTGTSMQHSRHRFTHPSREIGRIKSQGALALSLASVEERQIDSRPPAPLPFIETPTPVEEIGHDLASPCQNPDFPHDHDEELEGTYITVRH